VQAGRPAAFQNALRRRELGSDAARRVLAGTGAAREAVAVVHVDDRVPEPVLMELRKIEAVEQAKAITLV